MSSSVLHVDVSGSESTDEREPLHFEPEVIWSIDKAIYEVGMGPFQWYVFCITGVIWASDAMEMMLLSFLLPDLKKEWDLTPWESGLVGQGVFIGMLCGATILSNLADRYGRKKIIFVGTAGTAIFGALSGLAPNLGWMIFFRFGVGFFMTAGCVALTLFSEFLPTEFDPDPDAGNPHGIPLRRTKSYEQRPSSWLHRGEFLIIQGIFWSMGALTSVALAWIVMYHLDWRWYLFFSSIPLFIASIGVLYLPPSPQFLIADGRIEDAMDVVYRIARTNNYELPHGWALMPDPKANKGKLSQLCTEEYRDTTFLLFFIYSMCVFSYYGLSFISVRYFGALDAYYHSEKDLYMEMFLTTLSEIPALGIGLLLINRFGRRGMMNVAFLFFSATMCLLVIHDIQRVRWLGIALVFISRMWINLGFIGMGIYYVEYYRTEIRATALGFAISLGRIMGIITTYIAESMSITLGMYLYGCSGLVAFMASILLMYDSVEITKMRAEKEEHEETVMQLPISSSYSGTFSDHARREATPIIN